MLVLRTEGEQEQSTRRREPLDQGIEHALGLAIDPVDILEHQQHGLHMALSEDEAPEGIERPLPSLRRAGVAKGIVRAQDPEQRLAAEPTGGRSR